MKLYKFTKIEFALDIIKNERLFLNSPDKFNDPFDCMLDPDGKALEEAGALIVNYFQFKDLYDFAFNHFDQIKNNQNSAKKILQYGNTLKTTLSLYPYYSKWNYINEIQKNSNDFVKQDYKNKKILYLNLIKKTLNDIRAKTLVYCFSKTNQSILLWSHYADSHKGVCVEFDIDNKEKDIIEVSYEDKRAKFDILKIVSLILALDFLNKPFNSNDKDFNQKIMKPYYTKSLEWKYEEEARYILHKTSCERVFKIGNDYYITSPKIKSITLGCCVDKNAECFKDLIDVAKEKGIEIKHAIPNQDCFCLEEHTFIE